MDNVIIVIYYQSLSQDSKNYKLNVITFLSFPSNYILPSYGYLMIILLITTTTILNTLLYDGQAEVTLVARAGGGGGGAGPERTIIILSMNTLYLYMQILL